MICPVLARFKHFISVWPPLWRARWRGSYTAKLVASGWSRIAQKVGEEGLETALAGAGGTDGEVIAEVSDLLYHVLVLLKARGLTLERVIHELRGRHEELRRKSD